MKLFILLMLLVVKNQAYRYTTTCDKFVRRSQGYSGEGYANNLNAWYILTGLPDARFYVTVDTILQEEDATLGCLDHITAYDGETTTDPVLLEQTCGNASKQFETGANVFGILFHTDGSINATGFGIEAYQFCETCDLEGCVSDEPEPPECTDRPGSCSWGKYKVMYRCANETTKYCTTPCYTCNMTIPSCKDVDLGGDWFLVDHTPCSQSIGVGMMVELYMNDAEEEKTCLRPCCCDSRPSGSDVMPAVHCGSDGVSRISSDKPTFCPGYQQDFTA